MTATTDSGHVELTQNTTSAPIRLINKKQVLNRVPLSYPTVWSLMRQGKFPRSRAIGGKACWVESEIDQWIADLPIRRLKGDKVGA